MNKLARQPNIIIKNIASFLECEEYAKMLSTCNEIYQDLASDLPSKQIFYLHYSNSYGPMTYAECAYPYKYKDSIDFNEYDGLDRPTINLNNYIALELLKIDLDSPNIELKSLIEKIRDLKSHNQERLCQELKYFPKIHKRNQILEINQNNSKNKRNNEFWPR